MSEVNKIQITSLDAFKNAKIEDKLKFLQENNVQADISILDGDWTDAETKLLEGLFNSSNAESIALDDIGDMATLPEVQPQYGPRIPTENKQDDQFGLPVSPMSYFDGSYVNSLLGIKAYPVQNDGKPVDTQQKTDKNPLWQGFAPALNAGKVADTPSLTDILGAAKTPAKSQPVLKAQSQEDIKFNKILAQYKDVSVKQFRSQFTGDTLEELDRITDTKHITNDEYTLEKYERNLLFKKLNSYMSFKKFVLDNVKLPETEVGKLRQSYTDRIMSGKHNDEKVLNDIKSLDEPTFKKVFADPEFIAKFTDAMFNGWPSNDVIAYLKEEMFALANPTKKLGNVGKSHNYETTKAQLVGWATTIQNKMKVEAEAKAKAEAEAKAKAEAEAKAKAEAEAKAKAEAEAKAKAEAEAKAKAEAEAKAKAESEAKAKAEAEAKAKVEAEAKAKAEAEAKAKAEAEAKAKAEAEAEEAAEQAEKQAKIDAWTEENLDGDKKAKYTWAPIKNLPVFGHEEDIKQLQDLKDEVAKYLPDAKEGEFDFHNVDRLSMKGIDYWVNKKNEEIKEQQKLLDADKKAGAPDDVLAPYQDKIDTDTKAVVAFTALKSFIQDNYTVDELKLEGRSYGFEAQLPQLDVTKLSEEDKKAYDGKLAAIKSSISSHDELEIVDTDLSKLTVADWNDVIKHYNDVLKDTTIKPDEKEKIEHSIKTIEDYKDFTSAKALEQAEPGFLTKAAATTGGTLLIPLKAAHGIAKYLTGDIAKDIIAAGHRTEYLYKDGYSEGGFSGFAKGTLQGAVGTVLNTGTTVVNAGSSLVGKTTDMLEDATDRTDNMDDGNKKSIAKGVNSGLKLTSAVANLAGGILDWASYGISGDYVLGQNEILEKITNKTIDALESKKDDKSPEYVNEMRFVTDLCKQLNISKAELDKMPADQVRKLIKDNWNVIDADLLVKNATVLGMKAQFDNAKNLLIVTDATGTAKLKKAGEQAVGAVVDAAGLVGGTLSEVGEATSALGKVFVPTGNGIGKDLDNLGKEIKDIADMPANIVNTVTDSVEAIVDDIPAVGGGVAKTVDGASNIVTGLAGSVTGLVTGQFSDAGESVVNAGKGVLNVGKGLVNTVTFGTLFGDAIDDVEDAAEDAKDYLEDVREELADAKEETDLEDKKEEIEDATKYAQKAMKAANEALLEAQKVADAAQKDAAKKLTEAAYNDALTALNEVNEARKAVGLPEIPNTLKLQKDIKKTASVADVKAQAVDNSDFVKNIKPQLEKRMDKIIESMIPAETMKKLSIALADDELKKLNEVINSDDSTKADKDNAKYSKLVILAAMTTDEAKKDDYINEMIKFYGKEDPDYFEVANLRARIEDQIAAWDKANKEKVHKPFSEILMAGFSKFEANRIAQRAQNAALFGDNKDDWSWTSFWNAVDHTPAQELNAGDRGFWANSGSVLKGFMAGIPSALLRDSSLTAWQAASTVPFMEHIGPLNAFFLMGLGAKEHIEGAIDIVNGKYNSAQKASGYEQQGYAILKDIVVWWSHHHNNHVRAGKPSEPCKPNDPMNTDPGFFDPTQWDPSKVPFIE